MELSRRDADLGAQPEDASVMETGGGVMENGSGIYFPEKSTGILCILSHDGIRMAGSIAIDMFNRLIEGIHDTDRNNKIKVLGMPIVLCRGKRGGNRLARRIVS